MMSITQLGHVYRVVKEKFHAASEEDKQELLEQTLLMTLSRATRSDINVDIEEVHTVQKIYNETTGKEVSEKDVRMAANSEIYETESFEVLLDKVRIQIGEDACILIAKALAEVIKVDGNISPFEIEFFQECLKALGLEANQLGDLHL
jgi:uncharacterized tellurite resistance protein B-like protein